MTDESSSRKAKILIIDDEKTTCELLKSTMERTKKYEVWSTTSPSEGIDLAKKYRPDLILLDIVMPEMDGTEVATRLGDDPSTKNILIVFVSVLANQEEVDSKKGVIGGHPFISKPLNTKILMARIDSLLEDANIITPNENHAIAEIPTHRESFASNLKFMLFKFFPLKSHPFPERKRF